MQFILIAFTIILSILALKQKSINVKVLIYITIGIYLIRDTEIVGLLTVERTLALIPFLCLLLDLKNESSQLKRMPMLWLLLLIAINYLLIAIGDNRYNILALIGRAFFRYLSEFFFICLGYLAIKKKDDTVSFLKIFYKIGFFVFLYTMLSVAIRQDVIGELLGTENIAIGDRLRYPSFTGMGYNGFIGAILVILSFNNPYRVLKKYKKWSVFCMGLLLVALSGFRIHFLVALGGLALSFILGKKSKTILTLSVGILIAIVAYLAVPQVEDYVNSTFALTSETNEVEGSNLDMRQIQWEMALTYLYEKPYWGHGFSYFAENIIPFYGRDNGFNGGLMGAEGYYILMFIEEGSIQVVLSTLFFLIFLIYFIKNRKFSMASIGASLIFGFFLLCIGTRPDESWGYIFPLIGVCLKETVLAKKEEKKKYFKLM